MSRHEHDREDLLAEATALLPRVELSVPDEAEPVVAGFRQGGACSIFFGGDPAYHFDARGRLRRAFVAGYLFRSQGTTLARLLRERSPDATHLLRHDLTPGELQSFLQHMQGRLQALRAALVKGRTQVLRQVPDEGDVCLRLIQAIAAHRTGELAPAIGKSRS